MAAWQARVATEHDLDAINAIYSHYVLHTTSTFHTQPLSAAERLAWWHEHAERYPVLVLANSDEIGGWASLSPYIGRCAYRFTAETSIYLTPPLCGRGHGTVLLSALLACERTREFHTLLALISAEQEASIRLHARLGFQPAGRLREVGFKFGRWLDVIVMQRSV